MKKIFLIITVVLIVIISSIGVYSCYYLSPDDYGEQYNKTWKSDDGKIVFVTNNEKGLFDTFAKGFLGTYKKNGEVFYVSICFDNLCRAYFRDGMGDLPNAIFTGEHSYNFITQTLTVHITHVENKKSEYSLGDVIVFHRVSTEWGYIWQTLYLNNFFKVDIMNINELETIKFFHAEAYYVNQTAYENAIVAFMDKYAK